MRAGFESGKIYEVIYRAKDPVVVGTGLAAVRDMISYLKYDTASIAPTKFGIAYGVSQTGRFLRHFLFQGFNVDERGRKTFDGIFAHTAGAGRGSFNHRFAQPSRDAQPYTTFFYPTDVFPFTTAEESDPVTGARDGLRVHSRACRQCGAAAESVLRGRRLRVLGTRGLAHAHDCGWQTRRAVSAERATLRHLVRAALEPGEISARGGCAVRKRALHFAAIRSISGSRCGRCSWRSSIG